MVVGNVVLNGVVSFFYFRFFICDKIWRRVFAHNEPCSLIFGEDAAIIAASFRVEHNHQNKYTKCSIASFEADPDFDLQCS
jgi:hypothetical protein